MSCVGKRPIGNYRRRWSSEPSRSFPTREGALLREITLRHHRARDRAHFRDRPENRKHAGWQSLTKVVHSILNASIGLMEAARLAGTIPAMAADTASVAMAATITVKLTLLIS